MRTHIILLYFTRLAKSDCIGNIRLKFKFKIGILLNNSCPINQHSKTIFSSFSNLSTNFFLVFLHFSRFWKKIITANYLPFQTCYVYLKWVFRFFFCTEGVLFSTKNKNNPTGKMSSFLSQVACMYFVCVLYLYTIQK